MPNGKHDHTSGGFGHFIQRGFAFKEKVPDYFIAVRSSVSAQCACVLRPRG